MSEHQPSILSLIRELHDQLSQVSSAFQQTSSYIDCCQAFDRLCLGYRRGVYSDAEVASGLAEIRQTLSSLSAPVNPLMPHTEDVRSSVMARNYQGLAERMLEQSRGSWDSRHLEIVQGAISALSRYDGEVSGNLASRLQQRMSEDVWVGNLELSEDIHEFEQAAQSVQNSLSALLQARADSHMPETAEVPDSERVYAKDPELVSHVINQARQRAVNSDNHSVESHIEPAVLSHKETGDSRRQSEVLSTGVQRIQDAAHSLISAEYSRLGEIYKSVMIQAKSLMKEENIQVLQRGLEHAFDERHESMDVQSLSHHISELSTVLKDISDASPEVQRALASLNRMQYRAAIIREIISDSESTEKQTAQYLDARMLYEQKRMQFERRTQAASTADMYKAMDTELSAPVFDSAAHMSNMQENLKRIRQIAQSAGEVGLYASSAGSEYTRNVSNAIKTADQATPMVTPIPSIQSGLAQKSNRLIQMRKQLAYHPSARNDMGFSGARYEMMNQAQPLFKRVRFQKDNAEANRMLPALYRVAGIKLKENVKDTPLRKAFNGLNLSSANFELVKMLEEQFKPNVKTRAEDTVAGAASNQVHKDDDERQAVADSVAQAFDATNYKADYASDPGALLKAGHPAQNLESSLRTEERHLPKSVQKKLAPFFNFDISNVRIFAGPIAATAADAMGAHAFTLGQNIFVGENQLDYNTPEGLGLLAHEILHTSHFDSNETVDAKETAAESMESRVRQAMGDENHQLALERGVSKSASAVLEDPSKLNNVQGNMADERPRFDVEDVYDEVCDRVMEMMMESLEIEKHRRGD